MAFDATKPNTSQQIGDVITATRDNDVALKAQIDAHQVDSTAHGLPSLVATQADYVAHKADSTTAHGLATTNAGVLALQTEMGAARGSQSTLATRLASALNADGSIRLSTLNNKWINNSDTPTFVSTTSFSVVGDRTLVYIAGLQLRFTVSGSYAYAPIASSSYSGGVTTVVLDPAYSVLTSGVSKVDIGLIAWDNAVANSVTQALTQITALQGSLSAVQNIRSKAGDPTASDLPAGQIGVWKNTTSGALKLWANDGGTLKSTTPTASPTFSGNVGIGAASIGAKVESYSSASLNMRLVKTVVVGNDGPLLAFTNYNNIAGICDVAAIQSSLQSGTPGQESADLTFLTKPTTAGNVERLRIKSTGEVLVTNPAGLGYGPGAGGTVTQATSKSTAVTLNKPCGQITMNNASLAAGETVVFLVNNSCVGANDTITLSFIENGVAYSEYNTWPLIKSLNGGGGFYIYLKNIGGGAMTDVVAIEFTVNKGAVS